VSTNTIAIATKADADDLNDLAEDMAAKDVDLESQVTLATEQVSTAVRVYCLLVCTQSIYVTRLYRGGQFMPACLHFRAYIWLFDSRNKGAGSERSSRSQPQH
jgi:hypothetical protein